MRNPYEFSLGQIELAALSEAAPREVIGACKLLHAYLTAREQGLKHYQVEKERREIKVCRSTSVEALPRRKVTSVDAEQLASCVLVQE